jgi:hypothetical protein
LISGADIHEGGVIAKDFGDTMVFDEISQTFMNEANLRTGRAIFPLNKKTRHTIVPHNSAYWIVGEVSSQRPTIGRLILNQLFQDAYVLCAPYSHPVQHRWCFEWTALPATLRLLFGSMRPFARDSAHALDHSGIPQGSPHQVHFPELMLISLVCDAWPRVQRR